MDATTILNDCNSELLTVQKGPSKELQPVDLGEEPELAQLLAAIDLDEDQEP